MSKYEIGSLGWLIEQAKKDGFDNVRNWQIWKRDQNNKNIFYKELEEIYGKEFADWARQNRGKVEDKWLSTGCKTGKEYRDKCAQKVGFKDRAGRYRDHQREWRHETGRQFPKEDNPDCSAYFGDFTESLMIQTFECTIRMPYGNPGYDWTCKRGDKIDNKGRCLSYRPGQSPRCKFYIGYNNIADWFILSAWDSRDNLNPLHVWAFHNDDIVRGRKFWRRDTFTITNTPECLKEFEKYEVTDRLYKLKELCDKLKEE